MVGDDLGTVCWGLIGCAIFINFEEITGLSRCGAGLGSEWWVKELGKWLGGAGGPAAPAVLWPACSAAEFRQNLTKNRRRCAPGGSLTLGWAGGQGLACDRYFILGLCIGRGRRGGVGSGARMRGTDWGSLPGIGGSMAFSCRRGWLSRSGILRRGCGRSGGWSRSELGSGAGWPTFSGSLKLSVPRLEQLEHRSARAVAGRRR